MNNKFLFCAMVVFCAFSLQVNAQLEVLTNGNVKVSKNLGVHTDPNNSITLNIERTGSGGYGIKSLMIASSHPLSSLYGVYGFANATNASLPLSGSTEYIVGVYGSYTKSLSSLFNNFAAGVVGLVPPLQSGVGVYGGIGTMPSSFSSSLQYAGMFNGTVKVNGTISASAFTVPSSLSLINPDSRGLPTELANKLNALQPISYTLNQDSIWAEDKDATEMQGVHYGLVAEDVQKVFPELVYQRGEQLSINYVELIPLLLQQIQTLSAEVEELKKQKVQ